MSLLIGLYLCCLGLVIYTLFGFPLLTMVRGLLVRRPYQKADITPPVSLIICCFNEEQSIEAKLNNVLALDYPDHLLQVVVASDGSTDQTEAIVERFASDRIHLLSLPRSGKATALNAAVQHATGEVLVFSDANSMYDANAIRELVKPFAEPNVGGVAGNQVYRRSYQEGSAAAGEHYYWDFDRWMKVWQSRSGNAISATGAIYAIRRSLFQTVPAGVTDDFVTSTRIIEQGYRLVFAPEAICYEPAAGNSKAEFGRKTRVITRGLRGVLMMRGLMNPFRYGFYSIQLCSHKVLRRLIVLPLLVMAVLNPVLWNAGLVFQLATIAEMAFLVAALAAPILSSLGLRPHKLLTIPSYICMVNAAVLVAIWNIVRGQRITVWNPSRGMPQAAGSR